MRTVKTFLGLIALAVAVVFGRHVYFWDDAVERARQVPSIRAVNSSFPVRVRLNPVTNVVTIGLEVKWAADSKDLIDKIGRAVAGTIVEDVWPAAVQKELEEFTRERSDWYAMVVPYRAVVEDRKP
jgi:hypothetical protein